MAVIEFYLHYSLWLKKFNGGYLIHFVFSPTGSWSSASSREGSQPQIDCIVWPKNDQDETSSRSPDTYSCGSPTEESMSYVVLGNKANHNGNGAPTAHMEANTPKTPTTNAPKSKARANFSDTQMNILSERFSMQRYLSPSEMRSMAEVTGLTYKQVSGWWILDRFHTF